MSVPKCVCLQRQPRQPFRRAKYHKIYCYTRRGRSSGPPGSCCHGDRVAGFNRPRNGLFATASTPRSGPRGSTYRGLQQGPCSSRSAGGQGSQPGAVVAVIPASRAVVRTACPAGPNPGRCRHVVLGPGSELATDCADRGGGQRRRDACSDTCGVATSSGRRLPARVVSRTRHAVVRAQHPVIVQPHLSASIHEVSDRSFPRHGAIGLDGPVDVQHRPRRNRGTHRHSHRGLVASCRGPGRNRSLSRGPPAAH